MNLVRLQYGGGELHGASITVNTEESTLVGKEALLYKVSDLSTIINRAVFSALSSDGVSTATFNNIIEPDTYIVKSSNGTEECNTDNIEITSDDVINKTTLVRSLSLTLELNVTFYSASGETIKYKRQNSDELILLGKADNTGEGNGTIICKNGETITFSGDIAKDTTTGTTAYSKDITLTSNTTEIKIMPDGAVYWYGNQCVPLYIDKVFENTNGTYSINTNNITIGINASYARVTCQTNDLIDLSKYTKLRMLSTATGSNIKFLYTSYQKGNANAYSHREDSVNYPTGTNQITDLNLTKTASPINCCVSIANSTTAHSGECIIYALWLE